MPAQGTTPSSSGKLSEIIQGLGGWEVPHFNDLHSVGETKYKSTVRVLTLLLPHFLCLFNFSPHNLLGPQKDLHIVIKRQLCKWGHILSSGAI